MGQLLPIVNARFCKPARRREISYDTLYFLTRQAGWTARVRPEMRGPRARAMRARGGPPLPRTATPLPARAFRTVPPHPPTPHLQRTCVRFSPWEHELIAANPVMGNARLAALLNQKTGGHRTPIQVGCRRAYMRNNQKRTRLRHPVPMAPPEEPIDVSDVIRVNDSGAEEAVRLAVAAAEGKTAACLAAALTQPPPPDPPIGLLDMLEEATGGAHAGTRRTIFAPHGPPPPLGPPNMLLDMLEEVVREAREDAAVAAATAAAAAEALAADRLAPQMAEGHAGADPWLVGQDGLVKTNINLWTKFAVEEDASDDEAAQDDQVAQDDPAPPAPARRPRRRAPAASPSKSIRKKFGPNGLLPCRLKVTVLKFGFEN